MKNEPNPSHTHIDEYFVGDDIHDLEREQRGGVLTCLVAFLAFLAEAALLYAVLMEGFSFLSGLLIHIIIVGCLIVYNGLFRASSEGRFARLLPLSVGTMGVYGAVGVMVTALSHLWFTRTAHPFKHWYENMFPEVVLSQAERVYDDIRIGRDESAKTYSVVPFLDVMSFGSEIQKRQALARMTSHFSPQFAPAIKKALGDASNMIRVQAATAIVKIEQQFVDRLMKLSRLAEHHPRDAIVLLALAGHYDQYAYAGLLDRDQELSNRKLALEYYNRYLELKPEDIEVRARIGRLYMRNQDYGRAATWLRECIDKGYQSDAMRQWYMEALFASRRYEELRRFSNRMPPVSGNNAVFNPALKEAVDLWAAEGSHV